MHFHQSKERRLYRAWLHYGRQVASVEVSWGGTMCHLSLGFDDERGWGLSLAVPMLAWWLHVGIPGVKLRHDRELRLSVHGWALWWSLWRDPMGGWSRDTPRWREGNFNLPDFLLGRWKCTTKVLEERQIVVPMPEGGYPAKAQLVEYTWKRPRWFATRRTRVQIDMEKGIPSAGKGENGWDCDDDATFGMTTGECSNIPEGVGMLVGSVLRTRVKRGGWSDYNWQRASA